ncbi:MAG: acyl-CoA dehydrogenase [Catenulispora sp. 13_1_20CM_3_70_7]|nr:MAG: acyl-CoA dehydrogenase [Catenulispora sp. 13_1_20CM_3_70_7]
MAQLARSAAPVLARYAAQVDREASFPAASVRALRDGGLFGLLVPEEYGGLGGDLHDLADAAQILAGGCLSTAMIWVMHGQQVDAIARFGTERLRKDVLPRIAAGEVYVGSVTTEPGTGSSLLTAHAPLNEAEAAEELRLERDAPVVTGGEHADAFLVTMRDAPQAAQHRVTMVYAARAQLRVRTSGGWDPLGMRGTHSVGLRLAGEVPAHQVVGGRGDFRRVAVESMIPAAHVGWSACWLGAARAALAAVVALARSPRRPAGLDPASDLVAERLARVRIDLEVVGAYLGEVVREVCARRRAGDPLDLPATQIHLNTLKVVAAESTYRAVDRLVRLTGLATGYLKDSPVPLERQLRDLRSASLNYADDRLLVAVGALSLADRAVATAGGAPAAYQPERS